GVGTTGHHQPGEDGIVPGRDLLIRHLEELGRFPELFLGQPVVGGDGNRVLGILDFFFEVARDPDRARAAFRRRGRFRGRRVGRARRLVGRGRGRARRRRRFPRRRRIGGGRGRCRDRGRSLDRKSDVEGKIVVLGGGC